MCVAYQTPFLHTKLITFQCIQVTDNDLADRWLAVIRQEGGIVASKVCLQTLSISFPLHAIFSPFPRLKKIPGQSVGWKDMIISRKQCLGGQQLSHNTSNRPNVHCQNISKTLLAWGHYLYISQTTILGQQ